MPASWGEAARLLADPPRPCDWVELRLDRIGQQIPSGILSERRVQVVVSCRRAVDGGLFRGPERERMDLLLACARSGADFVDVEVDCAAAAGGIVRGKGIVSWHGNGKEKGWKDPAQVVRRAASFGPRYIKMVPTASALADNLELFRLLEAHRDLPLIAFCGGERGRPSRVLAARFGSAVDYVALDRDAPTAPGQYGLSEWTALFSPKGIGPQAALYGLLGNPLDHSASPRFHNALFRALGRDAAYLPLESDTAREGVEVAGMLGFHGLNVTAPFKEEVRGHLVSEGGSTRRYGAVNVLSWIPSPPPGRGGQGDGGWKGFNTDLPAFLKSIRSFLGADWPAEKRVLILGAGGAALSLTRGLRMAGAILFVSARDTARARTRVLSAGATWVPWNSRQEFVGDIVVNATPVGAAPRTDETPIHDNVFKNVKAAADLVYHPANTRMLEAAKWYGCRIIPGMAVFREQAIRSFRLFTGKRAPIDHPWVRERCADVL